MQPLFIQSNDAPRPSPSGCILGASFDCINKPLNGEVILTILASIAQQESASISQNIRLGIQYRFQQGLPKVTCSRFLGYEKDKDGHLVINPDQAVVVRRVYRDFLDGFSIDMIANDLRQEGVPSGSGSTAWPPSAVRYILSNEKYAGDLLLQKTLVDDFLTHHMVKNTGQLPQYYVSNSHDPVVPKSVFTRAADELWLRWQHGKKGGQHFGSRCALKGRTFCRCGEPMRRLRRLETIFRCDGCGAEVKEETLKTQVLEAIARLSRHHAQIWEKLAALPLQSPDRLERAQARRQEWQLLNLLPAGIAKYTPVCASEEDFRARTAKRGSEWNDDAIIRILVRVVPGESVCFKGGVVVDI